MGKAAASNTCTASARAYLLQGRSQQSGAYPAPLIAGLDQHQWDASGRIEGCEPHRDMPGLRD